ncbi:hypothetical protein [Streptomyces mayteni]
MPDVSAPSPEPPTAPDSDDVTVVTGLEQAVDLAEPVTCLYCHLGIVSDDDHATNCPWRPGKAAG